jgi:hypothetical protein
MKREKKVLNLGNLRMGDVVLIHSNFKLFQPATWLALIIRLITKNYFNHAAIVVCPFGPEFIYQSTASGIVKDLALHELKGDDCKIIRPSIIEIRRLEFNMMVEKRANDQLNKPYDYFGLLIAQLIHQAGGLISSKLDIWLESRGENARKRWYCSEFVAYCIDYPKWYECAPCDLERDPTFTKIFDGIVDLIK